MQNLSQNQFYDLATDDLQYACHLVLCSSQVLNEQPPKRERKGHNVWKATQHKHWSRKLPIGTGDGRGAKELESKHLLEGFQPRFPNAILLQCSPKVVTPRDFWELGNLRQSRCKADSAISAAALGQAPIIVFNFSFQTNSLVHGYRPGLVRKPTGLVSRVKSRKQMFLSDFRFHQIYATQALCSGFHTGSFTFCSSSLEKQADHQRCAFLAFAPQALIY